MSTSPKNTLTDPLTTDPLNIKQMDEKFASSAAQVCQIEATTSIHRCVISKVLKNLIDAVVESGSTLSKKQDLALQLLVNLKHLGSIECDMDIITRGEVNDDIYLLLEGSAAVLSADHSVVLRLLESGDIFGEISALHAIPPTANVRIMAGSTVFILPRTDALRIMKQHNLCSLSKLCIRRRYIPSGDIAEPHLVLRDLSVDVLRETAIFRAWDSEGLVALLGQLGSLPVTLCPAGADLINRGDEGGELTVVLSGRVKVIADHGDLCSLTAKEFPFIVGEEGFFNPDWESPVTFRTESPCYVISIKKYHISQLTHDKQEAIVSARAAWADIRTRWKQLLKARHVKCHSKYRSQFQIEVIQNCLSQTEILQGFPSPCLHQMALSATGAAYTSDEAIQYTPSNGTYETTNSASNTLSKTAKNGSDSQRESRVKPRTQGQCEQRFIRLVYLHRRNLSEPSERF
ncbi:hypothetical protein CAPTEDRAFT_225139 [Capitella teleta]|uniref:Cyclic nucleotide-binding domain-containing protein n=1 Tax=Capitella teleta TaxID=283909 RepID=R7TSH1_CAPTE|nr:hypothetical protein CAPTEDRAFT_225139 [Capitella teleta]|eukprot:ELT96823.1 hypothetical protein CAPTEDRAFT_225139 [Capitella teleta]